MKVKGDLQAKNLKMRKLEKGFTLIEMLIVVAIIAILAGVVLTGVRGFQSQARDTKRIGDMGNLRSLLELHFSQNNSYPSNLASLSSGVVPTLPSGTTQNSYEDAYNVSSDGLEYCISVDLENDNDITNESAEGGQCDPACADDGSNPDLYCVTSQ